MKKILLPLLITALLCSNTLPAQVTYTQGFENPGFPPTGWTLSNVTGNQLWSRKPTGTSPTCTPHSGDEMARFSSHGVTAGSTQALITPVIDYSAAGGNIPTFSLWIYRDTGAAIIGDSITISVNTAAVQSGATRLGAIARYVGINLPDIQTTSGWYQYTFNIPASFNTNTNYIVINGTSEDGNNIFIDDISWVAYPPVCTGTPAAGAVASFPVQICNGGGQAALGLNGATSGYAGITYTWQTATSATGPWTTFDSVATTGTDTLTATTYYRCIVSCTNSGLSDTTAVDTLVVSPDAPPLVTITPNAASYCVGATPADLAATGANTYTWSPTSYLNLLTDSTVQAFPASTTHYTVTGIAADGCPGTTQVTVTVRVPPVLTATAVPDTVCIGNSAALSVTASGFLGGATFAWYPDSIPGQTIIVYPVSDTVFTVYTSGGTGCTASTSISVYVIPAAAANFGYVVNGATVSFVDSSIEATGYTWSFGDGNTSTGQNPVYTYSANGSYNVQLVIGSAACNTTDTITKTVVINTLGIAGVAGNTAISVYPNPTQNYALVQFNMAAPTAQLSILNSLGQAVANYNITGNKGATYQQPIDMGNLPAGVYLIRVTTATESVTRQLVKE